MLSTATDRDRLYLQFGLFRDRFREALSSALALADADPGGAWRGLDVACGEGLYAADIASRYARATVVGFDRDPESIAAARTAFAGNPRLVFHLADVHEPLGPVVGTGFDVAYVLCGLTHFKHGARALRHVQEVLRPGGAVMLLDPTERSFEYPHPSLAPLRDAVHAAWAQFGTYAAGDVQGKMLADAGFIDVTTQPQDYVLGGPTQLGKTKLLLLLELLRGMRAALVDRAKTISAAEFDDHLARLRAGADEALHGTYFYRLAIARKPR
jgi:SAM-dependent methyltransferase